jgi:hypothetical protein
VTFTCGLALNLAPVGALGGTNRVCDTTALFFWHLLAASTCFKSEPAFFHAGCRGSCILDTQLVVLDGSVTVGSLQPVSETVIQRACMSGGRRRIERCESSLGGSCISPHTPRTAP